MYVFYYVFLIFTNTGHSIHVTKLDYIFLKLIIFVLLIYYYIFTFNVYYNILVYYQVYIFLGWSEVR